MDKKEINNRLQYALENLPLNNEQRYVLINAIVTIIEASISGSIPEIPKASNSALGGIKIGYSQNGKNYAVQLDSNGKAFVAVPWTDNDTTYSAAGTDTLGLVKKAAAVTDVDGAGELSNVITQFNSLLANLRNAGIISNS